MGAARLQNDASIVPYKLIAMFIADFKVSPRRDEGIPPYRMMADIDKYKITPPAAFHAVMRDCLSREFSCLSLIDLSGFFFRFRLFCRGGGYHAQELGFVNHGDAERLGFGQLGACRGTGQNIGCFLPPCV